MLEGFRGLENTRSQDKAKRRLEVKEERAWLEKTQSPKGPLRAFSGSGGGSKSTRREFDGRQS